MIAWIAAGHVDALTQFISLSDACHISLDARDMDARLVLFNDASYGPFLGSIISMAPGPNGAKVSGIGDVAGIYYRMIRWPNGDFHWTLSLSLVYPLVIAMVLPLIWLIRRSRRRGGRGFHIECQSAAG